MLPLRWRDWQIAVLRTRSSIREAGGVPVLARLGQEGVSAAQGFLNELKNDVQKNQVLAALMLNEIRDPGFKSPLATNCQIENKLPE